MGSGLSQNSPVDHENLRLNHRRHGLLVGAPRLKKARKVAASAQLGSFQINIASTGLPKAVKVAIAAVCSIWAFDIEAGATQALDVEFHHVLGNELDHLLEQISFCLFPNRPGQCDSGLGHRGFSSGRLSPQTQR